MFGGSKSSSGGTVEPAPFPQDSSSSWTGGGGMSSYGMFGNFKGKSSNLDFPPDTRSEYEKAYARSGMTNSMGGSFDLSGAGELFFSELFTAIGGDSPETQLAFALVTKGKVKLSTSAKAFNGLIKASKAGMQYTKSSLQLGQQMHKAYKAGASGVKEFRGIKGIRPDFVDFSTKTIYELKPFNPRAMQQGAKQLNKYKSLFEQNYGGNWKTVLDTY